MFAAFMLVTAAFAGSSTLGSSGPADEDAKAPIAAPTALQPLTKSLSAVDHCRRASGSGMGSVGRDGPHVHNDLRAIRTDSWLPGAGISREALTHGAGALIALCIAARISA